LTFSSLFFFIFHFSFFIFYFLFFAFHHYKLLSGVAVADNDDGEKAYIACMAALVLIARMSGMHILSNSFAPKKN